MACECLAKDGKTGAAEANRVGAPKSKGLANAVRWWTAEVALPKTACTVPTTAILEAASDSDSPKS